MSNQRRVFLINSVVGAGAALTALVANATKPAAATPPAAPASAVKTVDEKSAKAVPLAYVTDAKTSKSANYKAGQACVNCALYAPAGDKAGKCALFAGELVAAGAWCSAYVKKA